jgi:rhodanese-related sulfurtransferase
MRILSSLLLTLLVLVLTSGLCLAAKYQEIDVVGVKKLIDKGNVLVVNPLSSIEFDNEHIPGSVNIPLENLVSGLPKDKAMPIVFYCLGEKCVYSWRAAEEAAELGYTNSYAFRGGIPAWKSAGYATESTLKLPDIEIPLVSTAQLAEMLKTEDMVLLDINCEEDAAKFWIDSPKRLFIPLNDLKEKYATVPKNKKVVVLCLKGHRSPTAARYLVAKGFKDVSVVDGGIQKWVLEGRPVKKKN